MKSLFNLLLCLLLLAPLASSAQKTSKKDMVTTPVFAGGAFANIYNSIEQNNSVSVSQVDKITMGGGVFFRYYLGLHLALEAGFNYNVSEKDYEQYELYAGSPGVGTLTRGVRSKSISIPVNVQYHFLSKESAIRPYIGLGVGYSSYTHDVTDRERDRSLSIDSTVNHTMKDNSAFVQFAQGLTYQLNNRLQLNEVLFYQYEMNLGRQNVGLRLGVAYTLK